MGTRGSAVETPAQRIERILTQAARAQRVADHRAGVERHYYGGETLGAVLRRAQPTLRLFDKVASKLLVLLRGDLAFPLAFYDSDKHSPEWDPNPAARVEAIRDELRGLRRTRGARLENILRAAGVNGDGALADPGTGRPRKRPAPWREKMERLLTDAGLTRAEARARLKPAP